MWGWLTPDLPPTGFYCRRLLIPAATDFLAIVNGCLQELTAIYNFEAYGTATPAETAAIFQTMVDQFALEGSTCRVIGEIIAYAGSTSPTTAWLPCDGASLLRADYPDLFAVIGTVYGAVDGTHFNVPDLRGRAIIGQGHGSGLSDRPLGTADGEETHVLIDAETPTHSHTDSGHTHAEVTATPALGAAITGVPVPSAIPGVGTTGSGSANLDSFGADGAHNNMQPFVALTYLIVALP